MSRTFKRKTKQVVNAFFGNVNIKKLVLILQPWGQTYLPVDQDIWISIYWLFYEMNVGLHYLCFQACLSLIYLSAVEWCGHLEAGRWPCLCQSAGLKEGWADNERKRAATGCLSSTLTWLNKPEKWRCVRRDVGVTGAHRALYGYLANVQQCLNASHSLTRSNPSFWMAHVVLWMTTNWFSVPALCPPHAHTALVLRETRLPLCCRCVH